ncbi:Oxidoreductase short-chain dehydrogenase/reductase family [Paramagnetospirillum magnetotacticum MS-1]|uniref:Oxidoreductase short-chain dehydrogenase/reductase family n=1 Tax=Paramagnetospirillum magnetotacticum MS-1 TaxID=272627 RepID=A0A0C2YWT5_PARME|nr:SDR family NAD(P)-dependent oxidoreductase [Paramagnetospirillum magnetotacticum]KIL99125.1 Oxidoreductase short-chain dehydrogenase/reductase family [Paramagnetospirillum magnetotacticum MS-1]
MSGFTSILITGASSGLGAGLARVFAAPGITLHLSGRDLGRLDEVAGQCRARGSEVYTAPVDVTDRAATARWVESSEAIRPLDLIIANAGISAGTGGRGETEAQTRAIFATNVDGVFNTVLPAIAFLKERHRGQIGIMSSLASFRGFPGAPAYCASKAAVRVWGESLRGELAPLGVGVSVICPGFVKTPMTAVNRFSMPFLMDVERASRIMARGLAGNRGRIAFPWPMHVMARLAGCLPSALMDRIAGGLPRK